jgi:hypothetical protein
MTTEDELTAAVRKFVGQVSHWTPSRWAASSASGSDSRAALVFALVQRLADRSADAENRPRRPVPRLDNDLALPDQLRVMAADVQLTAPGQARAAAEDITSVQRAL